MPCEHSEQCSLPTANGKAQRPVVNIDGIMECFKYCEIMKGNMLGYAETTFRVIGVFTIMILNMHQNMLNPSWLRIMSSCCIGLV